MIISTPASMCMSTSTCGKTAVSGLVLSKAQLHVLENTQLSSGSSAEELLCRTGLTASSQTLHEKVGQGLQACIELDLSLPHVTDLQIFNTAFNDEYTAVAYLQKDQFLLQLLVPQH